jgi:hypothetical protein
MPLPRGASQAAVEAGCAGDWQKRRAKRGGTHAACAPAEGACERRSRVRCGADRSLGEWQRLWIGSNVGWGVVSCRRRFARWNPKRADPSARALFLVYVEVKDPSRIDSDDVQRKRSAAELWCKKRGMEYIVYTLE